MSGAGQVIYTESDNLVLDILGRDSPTVTGIGVKETDPEVEITEADRKKTSRPKACAMKH